MQEVIRGEIRIKGIMHGALNTLIYLYEDPEHWEFKQFVSKEQMMEYASSNQLMVKEQE